MSRWSRRLTAIVSGACRLGSIGQLTVLNGAEGVGQLFNQVLGMGAAAVPMIRNLLIENGAAGRQGGGEQAPEEKKEARSRAR